MHAQALAFYRRHLTDLPPLSVVEFGSCDITGSVRSVYPQAELWLGVDRQYGPCVDILADAAVWSTAERYDICVIAEVFEHTPDWREILATAHTVLTDGGLLLVSCATGYRPPHSAVDGGPLRSGEFYANVDPGDMKSTLTEQGWSEVEVTEADGYFGGDDLYVRAIR